MLTLLKMSIKAFLTAIVLVYFLKCLGCPQITCRSDSLKCLSTESKSERSRFMWLHMDYEKSCMGHTRGSLRTWLMWSLVQTQ